MFSFFKKKKVVELTQEQKNWNKVWELYETGELEKINPDIYALCEYESGINGEGHSGFFCNNEDELSKFEKALKNILPSKLYENFDKALKSYETESEDEICEMADDYFYDNEQEVINILQTFANEIN